MTTKTRPVVHQFGHLFDRMKTAPNRERKLSPGPYPQIELDDWRATMNGTPNNKNPRTIDLSEIDLDYFNSRIDRTSSSGCWAWTGASSDNGYGYVSRGRGKTKFLAHRVSYTLTIGPIPSGLIIDHLCRNRICVNPAHLEPVTIRINNLRGFGASGNHARQTHCIHGHEFTPENTKIVPATGARACVICRRERESRRPSGWERQRMNAARKESE